MSEMVERVARAIALAQLDNDTRAAVDPNTWPVAESYCDMARAAIEAMREPTNAMVKVHKGARYRAIGQSASKTEAIREGHRAMIDAALSEKS